MTRINSAIPVQFLTDEHLLAEHREIKRLPCCLEKAEKNGSINNIPNKFTLGKGHVLFFLNKQKFIYNRYSDIFEECVKRGFNVTQYHDNWGEVKWKYLNLYVTTNEEYNLLVERITERILNSKKEVWHYYGKQITKKEAIKLLKA